jgi:RNA polymerase sigma-70 factor, ECF subfamily
MATTQPRELEFTLLWTQAQPAVAGFIHGLVRDRSTADELLQEVAIAAFRSLPSWRPESPFTAWVMGIARNLVRMRWRTLGRQRSVLSDPTLLDALAAINVDLDEDHEAEQEALARCLESVTGRAWELLRLHYFEDQSPAAISDRLRIAVGTVRVQMHRIRVALRACIERRLAAGDSRAR